MVTFDRWYHRHSQAVLNILRKGSIIKYGKQQALKRKLDKEHAAAEEKALIDDMRALITKCEVLDRDNAFAYLYLRDKGYNVQHRLVVISNKKKRVANLGSEVLYKGMVITPKGLKKPKTHVRIIAKLPMKIAVKAFKDHIEKRKISSVSEFILIHGLKHTHDSSDVLLKEFRDMVRGYNAEGHAVHRLVARINKKTTYKEVKSLLRCSDMRGDEPMIGGVQAHFKNGELATFYNEEKFNGLELR